MVKTALELHSLSTEGLFKAVQVGNTHTHAHTLINTHTHTNTNTHTHTHTHTLSASVCEKLIWYMYR